MIKWLKLKLLNYCIKNLYCGIVEKDIVRIERKTIYIGDKKLAENHKKEIISQAKLIKELELWKILQERSKFTANQRMFNLSKNFDDVVFGKAVLYINDVYNNVLNNIIESE